MSSPEDEVELVLSRTEQRVPLRDEGFLRGSPVYGVLLTIQITPYEPVQQAFAWKQKSRESVRLILGQTNFFEDFEIIFRGREKTFDIIPHG